MLPDDWFSVAPDYRRFQFALCSVLLLFNIFRCVVGSLDFVWKSLTPQENIWEKALVCCCCCSAKLSEMRRFKLRFELRLILTIFFVHQKICTYDFNYILIYYTELNRKVPKSSHDLNFHTGTHFTTSSLTELIQLRHIIHESFIKLRIFIDRFVIYKNCLLLLQFLQQHLRQN